MNAPAIKPWAWGILLPLVLLAGPMLQAGLPPASLAFVLQADQFSNTKARAVAKLAASGRQWLVLDPVFSGDDRWTAADLAAIRSGQPRRKVLAYLSIGEAENYRTYWQAGWNTNPPAFLLGENPEWKGDFRVKYWQPGWQKLILPEIQRIMAAGFDGVYLDIVDGFETFEQQRDGYVDNRLNPETNQTYRRDMVDWVKTIAACTRQTHPAALIVPQNGAQLLDFPDFLGTVDAVGVEDLFTNGDQLQKPGTTQSVLDCLSRLTAARKPVLDIEYARRPERQAQARSLAAQHGFTWLITDRQLTTLGVSGTNDQ